MAIKEAIELLEKIEWVGKNGNCRICLGIKPIHYSYCAFHQALAILKEQPLAGEITKKVRTTLGTALQCGRATGYIFDEEELYEIKKLCDRLDTSEARLKDLLEALRKYGDHEPGCVKGDACHCGYEATIANAPKE